MGLNVRLSATKTREKGQDRGNHRFRLRNVSIGKRLAASFVVIILLMLAADTIAVWQFRRMEAVSEALRRADQTARAVVRVGFDTGAFSKRVTLLADSEEIGEFESDSGTLRQTFLRDVELALRLLSASPELDQNGMISSALETLRVALPSQLDTTVALANSGDWRAIRLRLANQIQDLADLSSSQVEKVDERVLQAQTDALERSTQARQSLLIAALIAAVLTLLTAAALGWYLNRSITVPLAELASAAHALARGDFDHQVNIVGEDELAVVGRAFNEAARQLQNQFEVTLEARVYERTRIAREIHDTLLQSFHGLLLRFETVSHMLPQDSEVKQKLDSAIEQAAEAVTEGRDTVQGLRDSTLEGNDLVPSISILGEGLANDSTSYRPAFRVAVEGQSRELHPIMRDETYKIAAEALRNSFRHAQARRIEVEIRYDDERFRLRVRDDGKGIDPAVLSKQSREGHYGLPGMRERAALMGAELTVWSEVEAGTEVELCIPAGTAYTIARTDSWFSRKFARKEKVEVREPS